MAKTKTPKGMVRGDDLEVLGTWPNINLIMMEAADYGAVTEGGKEGSADGDATHERFLRIHIDIPIATAAIFNRVRDKLAEGKRKEAHKIMKDAGMLKPERKRAKALIKAALLDPGN